MYLIIPSCSLGFSFVEVYGVVTSGTSTCCLETVSVGKRGWFWSCHTHVTVGGTLEGSQLWNKQMHVGNNNCVVNKWRRGHCFLTFKPDGTKTGLRWLSTVIFRFFLRFQSERWQWKCDMLRDPMFCDINKNKRT